MDDDARTHWQQTVTDLGIPPDLQAEIEAYARQNDRSPWEYLLAVVCREHDAPHECRNPSSEVPRPSKVKQRSGQNAGDVCQAGDT